ncbi:MAG: CdaR family protein [Balneolales bacterium]
MSDSGPNIKPTLFSRLRRKDDIISLPRTEKVIVFIVAYVIAMCLWLLVNLNRDYNLSVNLPVHLAQFQEDQALVEEPPEYVTVNLVGEGWKLITIYNNPPPLRVDPRQGSINLYDRAQETMGMFLDVEVQNVQPVIMNIPMEEKISLKVPIQVNVDKTFRPQYDLVGEPKIEPDSVVISGAQSLVEDITHWETEEVHFEDVRDSISQHIPLKKSSSLLELGIEEVLYRADVSEFTEGEIRVYVSTENFPEDRSVHYSPSIVTIRYDVPIDEYASSQEIIPFEASVPYQEVEQDTTGFVTPTIRKLDNDLNLRLRSVQPRRVSYYNVLAD